MIERSELGRPLPVGVQKASSILQIAGNIGFWVQLVLGSFALVILLLAAGLVADEKSAPAATGFSLFAATGGVVALAVSIIFFFRYKRIGQLMRVTEPERRPKRSTTLQMIKVGLVANLTGMMLAILGAEAFVGILLRKLSNATQGSLFDNSKQLISTNEMLLVLANTHTILCHFVGIAIALWLLERLSKAQS